jgi:4-amino-4-deoxy-L-arabinose transferase-like glycosyltransferase
VLAALLRLPDLATQSIWFDEAATWDLTRLSFGEMLRALPDRESNPPLFYALEWVTTRAVGDGAFGLRLLSALAGIALVPVAAAIGRRLGGRRAALVTAALVAANPLLVWFSQEARSYQLVALLSGLALLAFMRALDDDRPQTIAWWALAAALALCTHYFACFVIAPQLLWLLWRHPARSAALGATGALALVGAALLPLLLAQRGNPYDIAGSSIAVRLLQVPKQFLLGYRGPFALLTGCIGAAAIAVGLWLLLRRAPAPLRTRGLLVGGIGATGIVLPTLGALVGADYLNARNLIPALLPLLAALAAGFAVTRPPRAARAGAAATALLLLVSLGIVIGVARDQQYQRADWKGLAEALGDSDEDRVLVVSPANGEAALRFYRRDLRTLPTAGATVREVDVVAVATSPSPGDKPVLPGLYGGGGAAAIGPPVERRSGSWVVRSYRSPRGVVARPVALAALRFSVRYPSVVLLPASR